VKYFIVAAQSPTLVQQNAISNNFKAKNYGWWHWISNFWILTCPYDQVSLESIRDYIMSLAPGLSFAVLEVSPIGWSCYSDPKWAEWLQENWATYS
jgi:hypothetical protein